MKYDTFSLNALVLAGGINTIELFQGYRPGYKALLPFRGKPLIKYTLEALRETPGVKQICIVGSIGDIKNALPDPDLYQFEHGGETLLETILAGLRRFIDSDLVLIIPADLPLATSEAITSFLDSASRADTSYADNILWSMIPEQDFTGSYQYVKKGFNRFRDLSLCHGNLILMTPSLLYNRKFSSRMNRIYRARKSSVKAALAVGPTAGLAYLIGVHLFHALTLPQFARIVSAAFGVGLIPVIQHNPEVAVDIDEARDYKFIMQELDRRGRE